MTRYPTAVAIVLGLTALIAASAAEAADMTARAGVAAATAEAQAWQKDAALVSVSTLRANPDGTAAKWSYLYYSPRAKQGYSVDVAGGKVVETLEVRPHLTDAVGDFVDSDKALAEARKNGLTLKGPPAMAVMVMGQATKKPAAAWSVGGGVQKGDVGVVLDARTGKFSYRQAMP